MVALTIGFVSASVFIGDTPFSIWPGLVHLKCSFSFFQRMNFDGQGITDTGSTRVHGATLITPRCAIGLRRPAQANPTKKLGPDTIRNCIHYLRAVLRRIHVHSERPLAKGSTTLTRASATADTSAPGGTIDVKPFMMSSTKP